ncbi:MAG: winged helix-turn-helix transcriptional regulator [Methanocorpusculum sp.]|nr:winged helix-turn-helix transcriptional regulator [Methanocorpusculum sp.]MDE2522979.1 winged helix-turn-helix transcriptional regulator [Methanocorpusculum sp.]MDE2525409.1 winged helix-turn-helix transcriptional regulator [Methanocorpusculum sp.]
MMTSGLFISGTAAEETGPRIIDGMYISPMHKEIVPIDDGKEIKIVAGWDYLKFWRHKIISELIGIFNETILYEVILILSPFIFASLGLFCIGRWATNKKKNQSPYREKILTYIKANPGCTQKQLIAEMETSRGSVCYHLDKLQNAGTIQKVYTGRVPQYYPAAEKIESTLEQNLRYLLSRKKSGTVLQTLYKHPASTRKELAEHFSLSSITIRWYIRIFTEKELLTVTKDGYEFRYALTPEAKQIYERLTKEHVSDPASRTST